MNLRDKTVAVTGATGFLGRYIVDALLSRGARVVGVVRNPGRVPELQGKIELRRADLGDRGALTEALRGADALVSNAALFALGERGWEVHKKTNLEGTRNVLEAAAEAGVSRVVHVSSVAVYARQIGRVDEGRGQHHGDAPGAGQSAYALSKALSEQLAWKIAGERGLRLTCVRPCAIWGAHDPNFTPRLRRWLASPVTVVPWFCRFPLVYGGDVADAVALCLEQEASEGRSYNTTAAPTLREVTRAYEAAGGAVGAVRLPLVLPLPVHFDSARAEGELGWRPRPLAEAMADMMAREAPGRPGAAG